MAMKSCVLLAAMGLLLAGCAPAPVPDSGVGFSDYSQYELDRAQREAALTGAATGLAAPAPVTATAIPAGGIPQSDLAAAGIGVAPVTTAPIGAPLNATTLNPTLSTTTSGADLNRTGGIQASPGNAAPALVTGEGGISNSQDFAAISGATTIESAALARQQAAAQYQVIQPTALPEAGNTGPDIVAYALAAPNRKGQEWYSRFILGGSLGRFERSCASYRSPDEAQRDFLANGGPDRDPRGVDPDGDGFACGWDPSPFLAAVGRS